MAADRSDVGSTDWHKAESAESIDEANDVILATPEIDEFNRNRTPIKSLFNRFLACSSSKQHYFIYQ